MCVICRLKQAGVSEELVREVQYSIDLCEGFRTVLNRIETEMPGTITAEEGESLEMLVDRVNVHDDAFIDLGDDTHEIPLSDVPDEILEKVREMFGADVEIKAMRVNEDKIDVAVAEKVKELRKQFVDNGADLPDNTPIDKRKLH